MKLDWRLLLVLMLSLGLMISCESTDDDDDPTAFETLSEYMADNAMDSDDLFANWIKGASSITAAEWFIVDIRAAADFELGHIEGAVNSSLGDVLTTVEAANPSNPVLVVCYTGQSAGHAVMALRLSGYDDAAVLKFGMSGWHSDFDRWSGNTGDVAAGHSAWVTTASPAAGEFDAPEITTDETEGAAILAERVDAMLAGWGDNKATNSAVLDAPENYQIINYWPTTDSGIGGENPYIYYGHFDGAIQVPSGTLTIDGDAVMLLDPAAMNVIYCWTGQTSSMMTAWLDVLGYDSKSLLFGVNGMIHSDLVGHKWSTSADLAYVTGP